MKSQNKSKNSSCRVWLEYGSHPGGREAWGNHRILLEAEKETYTNGRSGFFVHGGNNPGSNGCVDLTDSMDEFTRWFRGYGNDIMLDVMYRD